MFKFIISLFLFSFFLLSAEAQNSYKAEWKKVEQYTEQGLPKSALKVANQIYTAAKKAANDPQIIKALVYRLNLSREITEESNVKTVTDLEKEMLSAKEPARSILASITAQAYWQMFQQKRFQIYGRTATVNFIKTDPETWTAKDFHHKIGALYILSLDNEKLLQQTSLTAYDAIIEKGNTRNLRPALYDLLAHSALEYFKNDEQDINAPSYKFEISDTRAFATAGEFASVNFKNDDTSSLHYNAILILQKLLKFHSADIKPDAFIDADLERLLFVKQYATMQQKDALYITALNTLADKYAVSPASAQVRFLAAQEIYSKASATVTDTSAYNYKIVQGILQRIINSYPDSEGGINAKNLMTQIVNKELSLTAEKVNIAGEPFRMLVKYKNLNKIFLRAVRVNDVLRKMINDENTSQDVLWKKITSLITIKNWEQPLPLPDDLRPHSTEIKIDELSEGEYLLISSASADFKLDNNPLSAVYVNVSDISFVNSSNDYFVLNRKTGKPLPGAVVQVWQEKYNYQSRRTEMLRQEKLSADNNGYFKIASNETQGRSIRLQISYAKDTLFLTDHIYNYNYNSAIDFQNTVDVSDFEKKNSQVFLFTDRSIYRPGQWVYVKGIAVTKDQKTQKSKLFSSPDSLTILLRNANYQPADSFKVVLNDFGSFNGRFKLPEGGLNGQFSIYVNGLNGASAFSMEEYKRPAFYTEFEPVKSTYRPGDTVRITGFAKAYAGNNIDNAIVKYRVTRVARFIYPWMWWWRPMPQTSPLEISHGEIETDSEGKFSIAFTAIPDLSIDRSTDPVFDYSIEADITDINGETRSASATVSIGYKALQLNIEVPAIINSDSLHDILVTAKNLSDELQPAKAEVKIYKLISPDRLIRERYWEQPDQFIMTKEDYVRFFPHDEYKNETKMNTWDKTLVYSITDSANSKFKISNIKLKQGRYVAEATSIDRFGQQVNDLQYFQVYEEQNNALPESAYSWNIPVKQVVQPGDKGKFISGSSASEVFVVEQIYKPDQKTFSFFFLNNTKKVFEFAATEQDRGGFSVHQFFVKDNRVYSYSWNVAVPWLNKQLDITYSTFRDKTLPGSDEKWKVNISGYKGQKVAAEMLVSMYDASLDQFKPHQWSPLDLWGSYYSIGNWSGNNNFLGIESFEKWQQQENLSQKEKIYDALITITGENNFYLRRGGGRVLYGRAAGVNVENVTSAGLDEVVVTAAPPPPKKKISGNIITDQHGAVDSTIISLPPATLPAIDQSGIQIRKNFNETAFFFPDLKTDASGNIEFAFTIPEALTTWKLMSLAHTKDLSSGYAFKNVVTQKQLMLQPNAPRFLREGDKIFFTAKVVNLSSGELRGTAQLRLFNAVNMQPVDASFKNIVSVKPFIIPAGGSSLVTFSLQTPFNYNSAVAYRLIAVSGAFSDGEEKIIPVLTNRMLVTETLPLPMRGDTVKQFSFDKLLNSGSSNTLKNYAVTVEYTTNPAWYAVQALPYLMENKNDCSEQIFSLWYANSLASKIVNTAPRVKQIFERWKTTDTAALLSNLYKNEELKSVLLAETPWVLDAQNETMQKRNIALLFDLVKMNSQLTAALNKLKLMQTSNGGFPWFNGGPDDRYITQYIVTGIGHLKKLNAVTPENMDVVKSILNSAMPYLNDRLKEDYAYLIKSKAVLKNNNLNAYAVQFIYMKSFFPEYKITSAAQKAYDYYYSQSKKYWLSQNKYVQAMIALALNRSFDHLTAKAITASLKERSINNEELGMYWKEWNNRSYWWAEAPIESQAMMIEAFNEIEGDNNVVDDLKTWLLKNKQTTNWSTSKATAEACYALLLQGTQWLSEEKKVTLSLGGTIITSDTTEAGTGYFKKRINGNSVTPEMGKIIVKVTSSNNNQSAGKAPSWGAVYWQYFEDLDKITFAETPLKLNKKIFVQRNTDHGLVISPIQEGDSLHIGDKIKVRIELRVDRYMEYVHMKDMRASCMEPVNVISQYKWQDGLGYYESTKDASTDFFFDRLNKGTYVFEYPVFVTHAGNFSNGITTIQSMYAPEFTSHSEGVRVTVK
ncbi:alpha-2-macroglobulin family protein [soil metagenome]